MDHNTAADPARRKLGSEIVPVDLEVQLVDGRIYNLGNEIAQRLSQPLKPGARLDRLQFLDQLLGQRLAPVIEKDLGGFFRQYFYITQPKLRMENLQPGP